MKAKLGKATYVGDFGEGQGPPDVILKRHHVAPEPVPDPTAVTEIAGQSIKNVAVAAGEFVDSMYGETSEEPRK